MITSRRHVKVLDFGLALQVAEPEDVTMERLTKAGTVGDVGVCTGPVRLFANGQRLR